MTPFELYAVLFCLAMAAGLTLWLRVSRNRGRRRIPERLEPVSMAQIAADQNELNRLAEKRRRLTEEFLEPLERQVASIGRRVHYAHEFEPDWLPGDAEFLAFDWPTTPPSSRPFDQDNPRPWAHG